MTEEIKEVSNAVSIVDTTNVTSIAVLPEIKDVNDDLFITEDDTFTITVRWYKDNGKLKVEKVSDDFDINNKEINSFTVTFKYPSQGDYEGLMSTNFYKSPDQMKLSDIVQVEVGRMVNLVRKWSLKQDMAKMIDLDPDIIKAMVNLVRDEIGLKGIL